ncbi:SUKH-4 family immunity protein [Streptomyces sp. ADMS]|uniref:SUKH-4 family immunity protein n=1 Tax=Streptomyces sp. ADMS TaxID=3071415 RepID=UPI00296F058D|nr:SUKH-4 family immunity protein [Streptomyces sp. ADMS]MDW4905220.1 SUKH-4 family immunity protein [Streptomyces sp. ADMS]
MSTTITLTRDESLTRVGLPAGRGQVRFGALRSGAVRTGALRTVADSTGETCTTYSPRNRPAPMDRRAPASALEVLLRFAAVTEEMAAARGQLAFSAGRFGSTTVAETSRHLLTVFARGAGGDVLPYWKMAALIRPLARLAAPGAESGLVLDLPARFLEQEFGHTKVARFEDVDFPAPLTHEPTRRFLSGTGLPEDCFLFPPDTEIPLPTLGEYCADEQSTAELPQEAGDLIRLGRLAEGNSLVLDGRTGAILIWNEPKATLRRLNTDISALAFTLWLLHRVKTIDFEDEAGRVL